MTERRALHALLVFGLVRKLDDGKGAPWENIVRDGTAAGMSEQDVDDALNLLMDEGRVYEPVLGRLKLT